MRDIDAPIIAGMGVTMFDLDKQALVPLYRFDNPLSINSASKLKKSKSWHFLTTWNLTGQGFFNYSSQLDHNTVQADIVLNHTVPGRYINGRWQRLGGTFGMYYNEPLDEWSHTPPLLEAPFEAPTSIEPSDPRRPSPLAEPRRVAPSGAIQPVRRMTLAQRLLSPSAESDNMPPPPPRARMDDVVRARDAAYAYKIKIDRIDAEIATVEREIRDSGPGPLLKEVAKLREALAKRHEAYGYAMQRQRAAAFGPGTYSLQAELDCTLTTEHPVKVREADAEISAKLDLVGKHGELQARLAKLTAQRSQLRDEQRRHSSD